MKIRKSTIFLAVALLVVLLAMWLLRPDAPPSDVMSQNQETILELPPEQQESEISSESEKIDESGEYSSPEEVALYIHTYGRLPSNFVTKSKAEKAGWIAKEGNLWEALPGKSIGGGGFGNREGMLPDADGRKWYECDVNYSGGHRGAERIVYSSDGLIYYTNDHYESFEQLY